MLNSNTLLITLKLKPFINGLYKNIRFYDNIPSAMTAKVYDRNMTAFYNISINQ